MRRLFFPGVLIALLSFVACRDQVVEPPRLEPGSPSMDDFHFGDHPENSHYRLGHIAWKAVGTNEAEFTYILAFRRYSNQNVGDQARYAQVHLGDGTSISPMFTVTHVDAANNWFEARASFRHTYPGAGPYTVHSSSCCRLSPYTASYAFPWDHINNPDHGVRFEGIVNFAAAGNALSGLPALLTCPIEGDCRFAVAASAPGSQSIRWRFASAAEMGDSRSVQPGPPSAPKAAAIDASTGVYTWDTRGAINNRTRDADGDGDLDTYKSVYSTQVVMETTDGQGNVVTKSAIDFLIHLTDAGPPKFIAPSPADGSSYTLAVGQTLSFTIAADDPITGDVVTLSALGLPSGADFAPPTAANPVSSTFSWTPQAGQSGNYVINFVAADQTGLLSAPLSVSITVQGNQPPVAKIVAPATGHSRFAIEFDGTQSSDPDGDALTFSWNWGDGTATETGPASSHARRSHTYAFRGSYTATLTVDDGKGGTNSATHSIDIQPSVKVFVDTKATGGRCDVTVIARNKTTPTDTHAQQADQNCSALFGLTANQTYVFGLHNSVISNTNDHRVWPDPDDALDGMQGVPTDDNIANRVGAVLVEPSTNAKLTPDNTYSAFREATALTGDRSISLAFHAGERIISCTLVGAKFPVYVYAINPLDRATLATLGVPNATAFDPGIGTYVDRVNSDATGECLIKATANNEPVYVEAKDANGDVYRELVMPGETSVTLDDKDPAFFFTYNLQELYGDNTSGKDDLGPGVYGTLRNSDGSQSDVFVVKTDSRAIQENGTAQFLFEVADLNGIVGNTIHVKVICSKSKGTCQLAEAVPLERAGLVLVVEGTIDSNGDGSAQVKFDFTGINSASVRIRGGVADGYDYAPNGGGHVPWVRTKLPGTSWDVGYP